MNKKEPNFLVIGAGKSGTTSLYEYLNNHPEVFMSPVKETNFFALEGEELVIQNDDPDQMHHYPWSITDFESYHQLFNGASKEKALGEVSPMYLYSEKAAENIKKHLPTVKLIVILRQPTDRLYSRYLHLARENRTPSSSIEDALDKESIWWKRNDLVQEGFYHTHLVKYFSLFPKQQIQVILYDDFRRTPEKIVREIYQFIGVDDSFEPDMGTQFNVSGFIANKRLDSIIGQNSMIKSWLSKVSPALSQNLSKNKKIKSWVNLVRNKNLIRPALTSELKLRINKIYDLEIHNLQKLINRDLTHWHNQ